MDERANNKNTSVSLQEQLPYSSSNNTGPIQPVPRQKEAQEEGIISVTQFFNLFNDGQLSPYLFDPSFMLIVDCRTIADYKQNHVVTSVHYLDVESSPLVEQYENYTYIILYDETGHSHCLKESVLTQASDKIKAGLKDNGFVLEGGFKAVYDKHPYLCTDRTVFTEAERQALLTIYPSIVLDDQLYQGTGEQAAIPKIVQDLNISHIVNISCDYQNAFSNNIKYLTIRLEDVTTSNLLQHFPEAVSFIDEAFENGGRVLVHCNLGASRSATITIAYLMHSHKWTLKDSFEFLKECRPVSQPNRGFFNQLSKYEQQLFGDRISDVDALWL